MDWEFLLVLMEVLNMQENGLMEILKDMEFFIILIKKQLIRVSGKIINLKVMELFIIKIKANNITILDLIVPILMNQAICGYNMMENLKMIKKMALEFFICKMEKSLLEIFMMIKLMVKGLIIIKMGIFWQGFGKIIN